ncbi:MAG TPA: hypothetical protein VN231_03405 [Allosphingosinicella sp.]|nr:hypothetical protein [Allosphingosinicella sp.]
MNRVLTTLLSITVAFIPSVGPAQGAVGQSEQPTQRLDREWLDRAINAPRTNRPSQPSERLDREWLERAVGASRPVRQPNVDRYARAQSEMNRSLDAIVQSDSSGWASHVYDSGSMRDAYVRSGSADGSTFVARGYYTYNGGNPGWVDARISNGRLDCVQYWNSWFGCRQPNAPGRNSYTGAIIAGLVVAVVAAAAMGPDGGYSDDSQSGWDEQPPGSSGRRATAQERERRSETPRIGGEGGLYGCASPPCWDRPPPE